MRIGIITGSGTYSLPGLDEGTRERVETPYGVAEVNVGGWSGVEVLHIARHGDGHARLSSHVDHRANIAALRERGADAILAVTVCGALDTGVPLGSLIVFDDLHFPSNRLADGSLCSLHTEPGAAGRGHWIFDQPFSPELRGVLWSAAQASGHPVRDGGTYGHVDGPRFNTRSEIAQLRVAGVTAVSQTAGPETVLAGEARIPYALLGYATDYANGVPPTPTPVETLIELVGASTQAFADTLANALPAVEALGSVPVNGHFFDWK
jgi:5'-methylthioadenosine phosphorylase